MQRPGEISDRHMLSGWPVRSLACDARLVSRLSSTSIASLTMRRRLPVDGGPLGLTVGSGWRIERVIGSGGSATVFHAQKPDGRVAAVKLMHHQLATAWSKRFEREAKLLQSL